MENAVDEEHGIVVTCRPNDVAARGRRKIVNTTER